MTRARGLLGAAFLVVGAALLVVLETLAAPESNRFWQAAFNFGHVPLFGVFALAVLGATLTLAGPRPHRRAIGYATAVGVSLAAVVLAEVAQIPRPRNASLGDAARGLAGAAAFLGVAATFDLGPGSPAFVRRRAPRVALRTAAAVVLLVGALPVLAAGLDYVQRERAFPRLLDFDAGWERRFLVVREAGLERVRAPRAWRDASGERGLVARVTFRPVSYSGISLEEPHPDWSRGRVLAFDAYSALDHPVELTVRVEDADHDGLYSDRFNGRVAVVPGANAVSIPLSEVRSAPWGREMDLRRVRRLMVFAVRPAAPFSLYLDAFRLE